jgi:serine/threonine protein kinase
MLSAPISLLKLSADKSQISTYQKKATSNTIYFSHINKSKFSVLPYAKNSPQEALFRQFIGGQNPGEQVGLGTDSRVFLVKDSNENIIAVKRSHEESVDKATGKRLRPYSDYYREMEIGKRLDGQVKNAVQPFGYYEIYSDGGQTVHYLAMNLVPGQTIENTTRLLPSQSWIDFLDVILNIDKQGVRHRDPNATNIKTDGEQLYVTDWGASKTFEEMAKYRKKNTFDNFVVPYTKYLSPTQLLVSNLDEFEALALIFHMRKAIDSSDNPDETRKEAHQVFREYLKAKGRFYIQRASLIEANELKGLDKLYSKKEIENLLPNEKLLAETYNRLEPHNTGDEYTNWVEKLEIVRMHLPEVQKFARLYMDPGTSKDPLHALYFRMVGAVQAKNLIETAKQAQKAEGLSGEKAETLKKYAKLQEDIGKYYLNKVFSPLLDLTWDLFKTVVIEGKLPAGEVFSALTKPEEQGGPEKLLAAMAEAGNTTTLSKIGIRRIPVDNTYEF